jgi:NADH-quinone oxidoreductase subunit C
VVAVTELLARLEGLEGRRATFKGMTSVTLPKKHLVAALEAAKAAGFEMISDIFGLDYLTYPGHQGKRFTVAYNLYSIGANERVFLRVDLDDGETLPSVTHLWKGASFMEREVFDMFGVVFEGHPDLRKLITPEDLDGHPHRKDFPVGETPTLFGDGRFLDPASFRAGIIGKSSGLTGWTGGARKGVRSEQGRDLIAHETTGEGGNA